MPGASTTRMAMSRKYTPLLLTAIYWSAWAGVIWWDQLHPLPNTNSSKTQRTASVSIATRAEPTASRSRAPKVETKQPFHEIGPTPEIEPSANPELEYDDPFAWVTISRGAPLRSGPSVSAPALDYQKMGDKLLLLRFENGWANVEDPSGKRRGWIWHVYLSPSDRVVVQEDRIASNDPAVLKTEFDCRRTIGGRN